MYASEPTTVIHGMAMNVAPRRTKQILDVVVVAVVVVEPADAFPEARFAGNP